MNKLLLCILCFASLTVSLAQNSQFPTGEIRGPFVWKSKIFPGTTRNYWIYVPAQYDANKPACLMVVQDGLSRATGWKLPGTLDSLINKKSVPVMIGVFIDHGTVPSIGADNYPRYNRCFEYDALGDRYARFLMEELLPEVSRSYNISSDPNDRSIAGASSGAICAFNVAWERPDQFRRVLSTIGTYVGLRGGDEFVTLVRKTEPKPLRIFLEDGTKDLNIYAGDWWMANQNMLSALTWSGYEVNHAWGEGGGHESKHAVTIIADALNWLWKDYPAPVKAHQSMNQRIELLLDDEQWKEIGISDQRAGKLAVNTQGEVYFAAKQAIFKLDNGGNVTSFLKLKSDAEALCFADDNQLYFSDTREHKIKGYVKGTVVDVLKGVDAEFMCASAKGLYFTEPSKSRIAHLDIASGKVQYTSVHYQPTGIVISAEQTFINVGAGNYVFGYSYKIEADGSLSEEQPYIHYQIPYGELTAGVSGMTVDSQNLLYSATTMGVQVSDQLGRVGFIFSKPSDGAVDVKIGGAAFDTMFTSCNGKIYQRKINAKGVLSFLAPAKPPKPGL